MKIIQILSSKKSREVTERDIKTVIDAMGPMAELCHERKGRYEGAVALAHCQVTQKDPLRFYVLKDGTVIINPIITNHTRHTIMHEEGCMSYIHRGRRKVERWNKCEIWYLELVTHDSKTEFEPGEVLPWKLSEPKVKNLSGLEAKIAQHEIEHFNGLNIYS